MRPLTRAAARSVLPILLASLALSGCGDDARDKIESGHTPPARNTQTYARELFDGLCRARDFAAAECDCMRTRMLRSGTRALAFIGATYGGDLAAAAEAGAELDEDQRTAATEAYLNAETLCLNQRAPDAPDPDAPPVPAATLADVRASCRPAMAEICACRAEALREAVGDGAFEAAIAINSGARGDLQSLDEGREEGWADRAADLYARTSAPCIIQAAGR